MAAPESENRKGDPAAFALRARPRAVTRLSRRTLVIATATMTALLFGALWWALGMHPLKLGGGEELYNTDAKPGDAVGTLPGGYAELTRPKPVPSRPAPASTAPGTGASPRLPDGAGQPPSATLPASGQPDPAAHEQDRARQQAAASAVFFTVAARPAAQTGIAGSNAEAVPPPAAAAPGERPLDADTDQNLQDQKQAFLTGKLDTTIYASHRLETPRSPYQLMAGTVIAAAMVTGLNSDLPGTVIAQVTEDVYDSVAGRFLLVPQGARLLGKYDNVVAYGQSRVLLIWTRLILPDGSSILLDNQPATDTEGYAGLEDGVDYHTWQLLRGIAFSTLLGAGSELATDSETTGSGKGNLIVALRQGADSSASQAGERVVSKDLAIQPTLTIRPGFPVRVVVNRDVILKPYGRL